jgi:hypothetical protein
MFPLPSAGSAASAGLARTGDTSLTWFARLWAIFKRAYRTVSRAVLLFGDTGQPAKNLTKFVKRVGSAPRRSWGLGCRSLPRRRCKGLPLLAFGRPTTAPEELASHIHVYALKRALTASSLARMYARRDPDYNSAFEERLAERPPARARNMTFRNQLPDHSNTLSGGPPIVLGQRARWRRMRSGSR